MFEELFDRPGTFERSEPSRIATREADVWVPFLQAALSGVLAAILSGAIVLIVVLIWGEQLGLRWWLVPVTMTILGAVMATWVWIEILNDTRELLWKVESYTGLDLNDDGEIGKPEPEQVRLEILRERDNAGPGQFFHNLPVRPEVFTTWARAALNDQTLAVGAWTGNEGLFKREDYDALMAVMHDAGVVEWVNRDAHLQGRRLTRPGRAALTAWIEWRERQQRSKV
jgi:hypothetical protein